MTNNTTEIDLQDILKTRLWFYDFLGKSFYMEPELSRLKEVSDLKIFDQLQDDEVQNEGLTLLKSFYENIPQITNEEFNSLKEEYSRLFVGPDHLPAPPWESVYLSKERIIFDEHTLAVREFYKKWGVSTQNKNKEPDDHIGFELEFMSILIDKSLTALNEDDLDSLKNTLEGQKEFLETHLLVWIEEFADKLVKNTEHSLFKGLGLFVQEYVSMDYELLQDLLTNLGELQ